MVNAHLKDSDPVLGFSVPSMQKPLAPVGTPSSTSDPALAFPVLVSQHPVASVEPPTQETGIYAYLDYESEDEQVQHFPVKDKYIIVGRHDPKRGITPEIDLSPIDQLVTVSRQHARIRYEETFFYIEDLKSRNQTRLGELPLDPLKPQILRNGDIVWFGSIKMTFRIPGTHELPMPKRLA
jgi:hypothetical protein